MNKIIDGVEWILVYAALTVIILAFMSIPGIMVAIV